MNADVVLISDNTHYSLICVHLRFTPAIENPRQHRSISLSD